MPHLKCKPVDVNDTVTFEYFDTETTYLKKHCDILQVAAVHGEHVSNVYVVPNQPIPPKVTDITQLFMDNAKLYHLDTQV